MTAYYYHELVEERCGNTRLTYRIRIRVLGHSRDRKPKTQFEVIRGDPEPDVSTVAAHATLPLRLLSLANRPPPSPDLLCNKNYLTFAIYGVL